MKRFHYAETLFYPGGTVAPPAGVTPPPLPPLEIVPQSWTAISALRGDPGPTAARVPVGKTRVIFAGPGPARVAFDFSSAGYRRVCGGGSCAGRTAADFAGLASCPAPPAFYY